MITINGDEILDPNQYRDNFDQFYTDNRSLSGKLQRNRRAKKKMAEMTWTMLEPAEFQALSALFEDGNEVAFINDASAYGTFTFDGIPDLPLDASDYLGGGTYLRDLHVILREV